jgi:hypothetical protein
MEKEIEGLTIEELLRETDKYDAQTRILCSRSIDLRKKICEEIRSGIGTGDVVKDLTLLLFDGFLQKEFSDKYQDLQKQLTGKKGEYILVIKNSKKSIMHYDSSFLGDPSMFNIDTTILLGSLSEDSLVVNATDNFVECFFPTKHYAIFHNSENEDFGLVRASIKHTWLYLDPQNFDIWLGGNSNRQSHKKIEIIIGNENVRRYFDFFAKDFIVQNKAMGIFRELCSIEAREHLLSLMRK